MQITSSRQLPLLAIQPDYPIGLVAVLHICLETDLKTEVFRLFKKVDTPKTTSVQEQPHLRIKASSKTHCIVKILYKIINAHKEPRLPEANNSRAGYTELERAGWNLGKSTRC